MVVGREWVGVMRNENAAVAGHQRLKPKRFGTFGRLKSFE